MNDSPNHTESDRLDALTLKVFQELSRHQSRAEGEDLLCYRYTDEATGRCFEVRQVDAGQPLGPFFITEFAPSGELNELDVGGNVTGTRLEPLVPQLEASIGPNGLIGSLRSAGIDISALVMESLPRPEQRRGVLDGLSQCAGSIAFLVARNRRYGQLSVKPLG